MSTFQYNVRPGLVRSELDERSTNLARIDVLMPSSQRPRRLLHVYRVHRTLLLRQFRC